MSEIGEFQAILLATQTINYISSVLNVSDSEDKLLSQRIEVLTSTRVRLTEIIQDLAAFTNDTECLDDIDVVIVDVAYQILTPTDPLEPDLNLN